jgi:hypothetical protein
VCAYFFFPQQQKASLAHSFPAWRIRRRYGLCDASSRKPRGELRAKQANDKPLPNVFSRTGSQARILQKLMVEERAVGDKMGAL